jgi:hypothetical protein
MKLPAYHAKAGRGCLADLPVILFRILIGAKGRGCLWIDVSACMTDRQVPRPVLRERAGSLPAGRQEGTQYKGELPTREAPPFRAGNFPFFSAARLLVLTEQGNHSVKGGKVTGERASVVFGAALWRHLYPSNCENELH